LKTYFLFIALLIISCCHRQNYVEVDPLLNCKVFNHNLLRLKEFKNEYGLTDIIIQKFKSGSIYYNDTVGYKAVAYVEEDNLRIIFDMGDCLIIVKVKDNRYDINIEYSTDMCKTFPEGNKSGTSYNAKLAFEKLVFRNCRFNVGDTLYGYFDVRTKQFRFREIGEIDKYYFRTDHYYGAFVINIQSKEKYESNPLNFHHVP
jgi:hypothetical protein